MSEVALLLEAFHAQEDLGAARREAGEVVARLHSIRPGTAARTGRDGGSRDPGLMPFLKRIGASAACHDGAGNLAYFTDPLTR